MTDPNDKMFDDIFAEARAVQPVPSGALMDRVLADAAAQTVAKPSQPPPRLWASVLDMLGGWPSLGGLVTAGVLGLWIGVAPPASLETLAADLFGSTSTVNFMTDLDGLEAFANVDG